MPVRCYWNRLLHPARGQWIKDRAGARHRTPDRARHCGAANDRVRCSQVAAIPSGQGGAVYIYPFYAFHSTVAALVNKTARVLPPPPPGRGRW